MQCVSKTSEPAALLPHSSCICEIAHGPHFSVAETLANVLGCRTDQSAVEALAKAGVM